VTQALEYLTSNQIVTRSGHSGFQLTGDNYQLPLYWDEQITPADPSPASLPAEISLPEAQPEKFSEHEKITTLEKRIESLEAMIAEMSRNFYDLKSQLNRENRPEIVNSTTEIVNSAPLINESINKDTDTDRNQDYLINLDLSQIFDEYRQRPGSGLEYSDDELTQLMDLNPDPDVLEFVLPRAGDFQTAKKWCGYDIRKLKYNLLRRFGVAMPALQRITDDPEISPWLIDYHYWKWYLDAKKEQTLGFVVYKIEKGIDRLKAVNADPLQYRYL
jgi:hypothetical protein